MTKERKCDCCGKEAVKLCPYYDSKTGGYKVLCDSCAKVR